jgi:GNAT superfamily N-acetyltransferase
VTKSVLHTKQPARSGATVRRYKLKDIDAIWELVRTSLPLLPNYVGTVPDEKRVRFLLENNQNNGTFLCLVLCDAQDKPVGGIGGYCTASMWSFDQVATDTYLYIKPEYRTLRNAMLLIRGYVQWAKARGAKLITGSHTAGFRAEEMSVLLKKMHFKPVGMLYHYWDDDK